MRHLGAPKFTKIIAEKLLLHINISNRYITLQLWHRLPGFKKNFTGEHRPGLNHCVCSASTQEKELREQLLPNGFHKPGSANDTEAARIVATRFAERALEKGHKAITWERGLLRYNGRIKTIIDTLRDQGLVFAQHVKAPKAIVANRALAIEQGRLVEEVVVEPPKPQWPLPRPRDPTRPNLTDTFPRW